MKILLTGGGSGGHFYPIIAIAEELNRLFEENKLIEAEIYYMADRPYNERLLFDNRIFFKKIGAGKLRRYFSLHNVTDLFKTAISLVTTFFAVFSVYPDVVFGKGGYVSFPVLFAARLLRIPIIIHESDSVPGRVNKWAAKFAVRIAVSYPQAVDQFKEKAKVAYTGNPIRRGVATPITNGAHDFLGLEALVPTILILGGSLGAEILNDNVLDMLPTLVEKYQIIHQTGKKNYMPVKQTADVVLGDSLHKGRYKVFDYLNDLTLSMSAGISSLVVSRAGSAIFEIATWGLPSIIIPITDSNGDHQRKNAFNYGRAGAAVIIEEVNLTPHVLAAEINRLMDNEALRTQLGIKAKEFSHANAARKIAEEIIKLGLGHEK